MLRSGRLTQSRVNQIVSWVEKIPNDLRKVARACNIYPADLLYWYALGQAYDCPDPYAAELAWRISEIRGNKAAENQRRIEAAANGGTKTKRVTKADGDVEVTEEDVLPAAWAIERLEQQAAASDFEVSPNDDLAKDLINAFESSREVPLLTSGEDPEQPEPPPEGDSSPA